MNLLTNRVEQYARKKKYTRFPTLRVYARSRTLMGVSRSHDEVEQELEKVITFVNSFQGPKYQVDWFGPDEIAWVIIPITTARRWAKKIRETFPQVKVRIVWAQTPT